LLLLLLLLLFLLLTLLLLCCTIALLVLETFRGVAVLLRPFDGSGKDQKLWACGRELAAQLRPSLQAQVLWSLRAEVPLRMRIV
jgi:hypothetical protein